MNCFTTHCLVIQLLCLRLPSRVCLGITGKTFPVRELFQVSTSMSIIIQGKPVLLVFHQAMLGEERVLVMGISRNLVARQDLCYICSPCDFIAISGLCSTWIDTLLPVDYSLQCTCYTSSHHCMCDHLLIYTASILFTASCSAYVNIPIHSR